MLQKRDRQQTKCTRRLAHLEKFSLIFSSSSFAIRVNPLTPGAFRMRFLDIFSQDHGQISFNLAENAFCNTTALLSCYWHRVLPLFDSGMLRNQNFVLRLFDFWNFFPLSFFSFSFLFAAVIDFLLGLLAVKKLLRKHHRDRQFLPWSSQV